MAALSAANTWSREKQLNEHKRHAEVIAYEIQTNKDNEMFILKINVKTCCGSLPASMAAAMAAKTACDISTTF